jgi:hypothetical protein
VRLEGVGWRALQLMHQSVRRTQRVTITDMATMDRTCRSAVLTIAVVFASVIAHSAAAQQAPAPLWRQQLVPWQTHAGQSRPWRSDQRLAPSAQPDDPDDFQVGFLNPDSASGGRHELMWVRAIAYDRRTDLFLGILLNQPDYLTSVAGGDNVVFRFDAARGLLLAVGSPAYGEQGWPTTRSATFFPTLRDGLRAYRMGNDGHNMPAIERCIDLLTPAMRSVPASVSRAERFVGHFVLGRCLAEKYVTERAIEQFRAAIALEPDDADSHMALLAELSVMTHRPPGDLASTEEARWERAFLDELAVVRSRFAADDGVAQVLAMVFDRTQESTLEPEARAQLTRLRRVGYAVFRWKQR